MTSNKYKYGLIDLSYILSRNLYACSKDPNTLTPGELIKSIIQTLNKISREYGITVDKYVFLNDTWSEEYGGYYRTYLLSGNYKTSRSWMTDEKLEQLKYDPNSTDDIIKKAEFDLFLNKIKRETKSIIKSELGNYCIPSIGIPGWEFDDLCYVAGCLLYSDHDPKPSIVITKDSDLQYSLNPKLDYFKIPTAKSIPEIITYSNMYYNMPEEIRNSGLSLYEYKSYLDSLGYGHNDMIKTVLPRKNSTKVILNVLQGDYSELKNRELFEKQLSTFKVENFPGINDAVNLIRSELICSGRLGSSEEFKIFCNTHGINISESYYNEFRNRFDQKLYSRI